MFLIDNSLFDTKCGDLLIKYDVASLIYKISNDSFYNLSSEIIDKRLNYTLVWKKIVGFLFWLSEMRKREKRGEAATSGSEPSYLISETAASVSKDAS